MPDGFLDTKTVLLTTGAATVGVGLAVRELKTRLEPRRTPLLGLAAAFIFVSQMLNFPVAGGTSGHLVGSVLAAVLLGPAAAVVVMTCVLVVQCLVFADGGLSALGANVFNMAIVSVFGGFAVFRLLSAVGKMEHARRTVFAAAFAGWFATVLASASCAAELALSGTVPWGLAFPAMANIHMIIGIGEGLVTGLIIAAILRARPELLADRPEEAQESRRFLMVGLLICFGLGILVAPLASSWPDGLEKVAATLGFEHRAAPAMVRSPLADYRLPLVGSPTTATGIAALIGTVAAFVAAYVLARAVAPGVKSTEPPHSNALAGD